LLLLFAWQYVSGNIMTGMDRGDIVAGLGQNITTAAFRPSGLVVTCDCRVPPPQPLYRAAAGVGRRPVTGEKKGVTITEQGALSGNVRDAGQRVYLRDGWRVRCAALRQFKLPDPIRRSRTSPLSAKWVHIVAGYVLAAAVASHLFMLRHQLFMKDGCSTGCCRTKLKRYDHRKQSRLGQDRGGSLGSR
jgi:cytochrome b561